ncbi:MAG: diguanylate cyclase [Candidatus Omnitrophica bacterium]|nr:diguanylate cyclase [Candidatus Omnitrophota bacterium]
MQAKSIVSEAFYPKLRFFYFKLMVNYNSRKLAISQRESACQDKNDIFSWYNSDWEFWLDTQNHIIYSSLQAERISGYQAQDFEKDPGFFLGIIHPQDRQIFVSHNCSCAKVGCTENIEFRIIHRDGSIRWISHVCQPLYGSDNVLLGLRAINHDITERKAKERELELYREQLELLVKEHDFKLTEEIKQRKKIEKDLITLSKRIEFILGASRTGLDIIDSDYVVVYVDPEWAKIYGDCSGKKCYQYFMGKDSPCPGCGVAQALEKKCAVVTEEILVRENNRPIQVTSIPFQSAEGKWMVAEVNVDITKRKEFEEKLRQTETQQKAILNNIPDIAWLKDHESRFIAVNQPFANACGFSVEQIIGKSDFDVWPKELAERYRSDDQEVMSTGCRKCVEEPLADKEGKIKWIETIKTPIYGQEGQILGTTGIARNITERKLSEEALKKYQGRLEQLVQERTAKLQEKIGQCRTAEKNSEKLNKELLLSNQKLKQLSLRDSHTGLYNHRYLDEIVEAEFHRAKRYMSCFSVMMLDLDYFKSINDVYGHQFGDLVLKQFSRQLKKIVRRYDTVIRYGGEEFIIISPALDRKDGIEFAQRLLKIINFTDLGDKQHLLRLKLTIAVASYPEDKANCGMDLVELVDQILNRAKEGGGNRVYSSDNVSLIKPAHYQEAASIHFLKHKISKLTKRANQGLMEAVFAFAKTIEAKDHYTGEHVEQTVQYATDLSCALGLSDNEIELVRQAAILHDLGKIGISENILLKKSSLTKKEFDQIKKHPEIGVEIIRPIHFFHPIIPYIMHHHERWDGAGYPLGLKKDAIPLGARIVALADVYQALISDRPYRKAYSNQGAVSILVNESGRLFDPRIAGVFIDLLKKN